MLSFLKNIISQQNKMPHWEAVEHFVVKNKDYKNALDSIGYTVAGRLDATTLQQLKSLYDETHQFKLDNGGMFYSVYSGDISYRNKVHQTIQDVLGSVYDDLFENYKVVLNSFIVKVNGPESDFGVHQDSTGLDETQYSPISVWIPLQDTTLDNGCLAVVPKSFRLFSPYRGISFPEPFDKIQDEVKHYLQPINLKAGDILLFDNRLVHSSPPNNSANERVVVMSGIFPKEAKMLSCYKDMTLNNDEIEVFEQADDYLLTFTNFFHDCTCRPETGELKTKVHWPIHQMKQNSFTQLMKKNNIPRLSVPELTKDYKSNIVSEPT